MFADPGAPKRAHPNPNLNAGADVADSSSPPNYLSMLPRWHQAFKRFRLGMPGKQPFGRYWKTCSLHKYFRHDQTLTTGAEADYKLSNAV
jgi:hypothetical protein